MRASYKLWLILGFRIAVRSVLYVAALTAVVSFIFWDWVPPSQWAPLGRLSAVMFLPLVWIEPASDFFSARDRT